MTKTLSIISFIAGLVAIIISFTPMNTFAYIPAILGLVLGLFAYIKLKTNKLAKFATILSLLAILIISVNQMTAKDEVAKDDTLELKENASKKEAVKELEELDGLE